MKQLGLIVLSLALRVGRGTQRVPTAEPVPPLPRS